MGTVTDSRALAHMTDEQLQAAEARAAADFTSYTLHSKRPADKQGDVSPRAWALRAEVVANAERRWLEIQAEWDRRG